jgi:damage-control phosphatase, subfamily I
MSLARSSLVLSQSQNAHLLSQAEKRAGEIIEESKGKGLTSPAIANKIFKEVTRLTGVPDPYVDFKAKEMEVARAIFSRIESQIGSTLRSRIALSVLGNSLDFFENPEEALAQIPGHLERGLDFYLDDIDRLDAFLSKRPGVVLFFSDNSGEIYFDIPLFEYMRNRSARTVLVVKGGPSLNDLTRAELQHAGLDKKFDEIIDTGTNGAGIPWERVPRTFKDLVQHCDLILSKGMANFETVYTRKLPCPVFFLFKVKCKPVQDYLKAKPDSFVALWKDGEAGEA